MNKEDKKKIADMSLKGLGITVLIEDDLKTLKDISGQGSKALVNVNLLKKEAIKWVKAMDKEHDIKQNVFVYHWMDFFNISEDDLK